MVLSLKRPFNDLLKIWCFSGKNQKTLNVGKNRNNDEERVFSRNKTFSSFGKLSLQKSEGAKHSNGSRGLVGFPVIKEPLKLWHPLASDEIAATGPFFPGFEFLQFQAKAFALEVFQKFFKQSVCVSIKVCVYYRPSENGSIFFWNSPPNRFNAQSRVTPKPIVRKLGTLCSRIFIQRYLATIILLTSRIKADVPSGSPGSSVTK